MSMKDRYIRGNHDNSAECASDHHWIPDGMCDLENKMMFIGGGYSVDQARRTVGVDWWDDEELSYTNLGRMIDEAIEFKPKIIVSHEAPNAALPPAHLAPSKPPSRTSNALETIFRECPPKLWVFGHHHCSWKFREGPTLFICCNINEAVDIDISALI